MKLHVIIVSLFFLCISGHSANAQWSLNGVKVFYNAGNVGIGTNNPAYKLEVRGIGTRAIYGLATAATGNNTGVYGQSSSGTGYGVFGYADQTTGTNFGVYGRSNSTGGYGVFGLANAGSGTNFGVYGRSNSTSGRALYGLANASTGTNYGIVAKTNSPTGFAGYFAGGKNYFQGFVGVGTTVPSQKLHVVGNAKVTGWIGNDTTDPVLLFSDEKRCMSLESRLISDLLSVNVLGGFAANEVADGVLGATIAGGGYREFNVGIFPNSVEANFGTIGGGFSNSTSGLGATVAGGGGHSAAGDYSFVAGGFDNAADANFAFAGGRRANAEHLGAFVWGDSTDATISSEAPDQFIVRASGGIWLGTTSDVDIPGTDFLNTSTGAHLTSGGAWTNASSRNLKENFDAVDAKSVLSAVARLPIMRWNYKAEGQDVAHIGPISQDFFAVFKVGADDKSITTVDADGVALAAIQGLHQLVQEKDAQIQALNERLERLEKLMNSEQSTSVGIQE